MTAWPGVDSSGGAIPLSELIERTGAVSPEAALLVLRESLLSLAAAHQHRTAHQDYRPETVLVDRDGRVELTSFGVPAQAAGQVPAAPTPYQAPELRDGGPASRASNLYAATAVFFECLTGSAPSAERIRQFRRKQVAAANLLGPAFEPLCGLMARGMAGHPANRPASARDFIAELDELAAALYGPDWLQRGRRELAERAGDTLKLVPSVPASAGKGWLAGRLGGRRRALYAGVAVVTAVVVLGAAGSAIALSGYFGSSPSQAASGLGQGASAGAASGSSANGPSTVANRAPSGTQPTVSTTQPTAGATQPSPATTSGLDVQLLTDQAIPKTVTCGSAPPTFEQMATVTSNETIHAETYHWVRPDGTTTAPAAININAGATSSTSDRFTPAGDSFSGPETLVFTSPATGSWSIPLALTCSAATGSPSPTPAPSHYPLMIFSTPNGNSADVGTIGTPLSLSYSAQGGAAPYVWTAIGLPPGLHINSATGTVSGTPTTFGEYSLHVTVTDSGSPAQSVSSDEDFLISYPPVHITATALPNATAGVGYPGVQFSATGGDGGPYTWFVSGGTTLPAGLSLSASGVLSGTPATAGTFTVYVSVQDAQATPGFDKTQLALTVNPA
jgi:eukaryotic-like serine/threonine-protein kinase